MNAAVVSSFDTAPCYQEFHLPPLAGENDMIVDVIATGLHPRVRSQADGSHYTSTSELPLVPGIDGVGRGKDGLLRYFILPDTTMGAMAEQTVIDARRSIILPDNSDPIAIAAVMNPAMSAWIALRQRVHFHEGQNVLVLGATGNAGQMAVQIAHLFGANQIIAVGRNANRLASLTALGATGTILLGEDADSLPDALGEFATGIDIVIDYLWGAPAATVMSGIISDRADPTKPITWIEIGSAAGATASIPGAALRAARLQIVGSGQGSVSTKDILAELPALAEEITSGTFAIDTWSRPLAEVELAWADAANTTRRIVFSPQP